DIFTLFLHEIVTIIRLGQPGGLRSVVAEFVLMRHQVLILNRGRKRAPNLRASDRIITGLCTLLMRPARVLRSAVVLKTSTLLHFHKMLIKQKYRLLFSPKRVRRPGPKGPTKELIDAVVEMKRRNRTWGCKRIAQQLTLAFGVDIDKDVVRRTRAIHFHPEAGSGGPSWLSFIGHAKDSLWSLDLFRCESAILRTYWVLVVMDQFTRRIVGFAVHRGVVEGWHCAGCSIARFTRRHCRNISVRIMIRCIGFISGRPTCVSSRSRKSRRCLTFRYRIRSWRDYSERAANT